MQGWANVSERQNLQPELAVSTIIFALEPFVSPHASHEQEAPAYRVRIPLVERIREPFKAQLAIPGGPLAPHESLEDASHRTFEATTGLRGDRLQQMHTFGGLRRSPGLRVVTVAYWALLRIEDVVSAQLPALEDHHIQWWDVDSLPQLAFDHTDIINVARDRVATLPLVELARSALPQQFTLAQLREVAESIQGQPLDPGNFQRAIKNHPEIQATSEFLQGTKHRPPRLYSLARSSAS